VRRPNVLQEKEQELFEKAWHRHHRGDVENGWASTRDADVIAQATAFATAIEGRYPGDLGPCSDFEWGVLMGRLYMVRWALGDEEFNGDT
jgi:hypothetical protein